MPKVCNRITAALVRGPKIPSIKLKALRLTGMLDAWSEQQVQPTYHDLSFDERFSLVVEWEHLRRAQQRLHKRLKQAQLSITVPHRH